jgi:hypothetical protein
MNQSSKKPRAPSQNSAKLKPKNPPKQRRMVRTARIQGQGPIQSAAVSYAQLQGSSRPEMSSVQSSSDLRIRVKHREYLSDIAGSVLYAVLQTSINPGLPNSFPWLSTIAANFESYVFNSLCFQYRTQASTASIGKAVLSVDWDAADPAPISKQAQLQERTKADNAVWANFDLVCDSQDLKKFGYQRYIRTGGLLANKDIKTYDVGNLWVGVQGEANANAVGELWVCYDVELITPQQNQAGLSGGEKIVANGTISTVNLFGNTPVITGASTASASVNTLTFPIGGQFLVEINATGTVITAAYTITGTATTAAIAGVINSASTQLLESFTVNASPGQTVILAANATTITANTVRIAPYPVALA